MSAAIIVGSSFAVTLTRKKKYHPTLGRGGEEMLRGYLNFRYISHKFTSSFANPSFQDLNGSHIMYWNMIILNPSRFKVEPTQNTFCIERWDLLSLRFSGNAVLCHIEWPCPKKKNRWECKSATISLHYGDSLSKFCIVWPWDRVRVGPQS